jgi:hypothetical protein
VAAVAAVAAALLVAGCGEGPDAEDAGRADAGTRADAGPAGDAGPRPDGGVDAGAPPDAGPSLDGGVDAGPPEDAATEAMITLSDVSVYANCMPIVAPDPIVAFWTVDVSGAEAGATVTLTAASLTVSGTPSFTQELTVDEPAVPLRGGAGSRMQRKTGADRDPPVACTALCDRDFELELAYAVNGARVVVSERGRLGCVF